MDWGMKEQEKGEGKEGGGMNILGKDILKLDLRWHLVQLLESPSWAIIQSSSQMAFPIPYWTNESWSSRYLGR